VYDCGKRSRAEGFEKGKRILHRGHKEERVLAALEMTEAGELE
jgi:hypothetical protein